MPSDNAEYNIYAIYSYSSRIIMDPGLRYQIREKLGKGGGGIVYSGIRKPNNLPVAIKRVERRGLKRSTHDGVPIKITLLKKVQNIPGIIKIIKHFNHSGHDYVVMEQFGSSDLFKWISLNGPSDDHTARIIFGQVVKTVKKCFNQGIVHGDIKDENILINPATLEIKIIDFGEGVFVENKLFREFHGTLEHSPP